MEDIVSIISQVGFPIAAALGAAFMVWKQTQRTQDFLEQELKSRDERTNTLLQSLRDSIMDLKNAIEDSKENDDRK